MACDEVFTLSPGRGIAEPATQATIADDTFTSRLLKKVVGDPAAVIDAAIPGAISGVLAGILVAILVGIPTGRPFGEIITKVLVGFMVGFAVGTLLGAFLGVAVKRSRPDYQIKPGFALLIAGGVIGGVVTILIESYRWIPLGAGVGALVANAWAIFCERLDAVTNPPPRKLLDEDFFSEPEARKNRRRSRGTRSRYSGA